MGSRHTFRFLGRKLFAIDTHLTKENLVLSNGISLSMLVTRKGRPHCFVWIFICLIGLLLVYYGSQICVVTYLFFVCMFIVFFPLHFV